MARCDVTHFHSGLVNEVVDAATVDVYIHGKESSPKIYTNKNHSLISKCEPCSHEGDDPHPVTPQKLL